MYGKCGRSSGGSSEHWHDIWASPLASAVTTRLQFNVFVLKLPIRPPALVAKQAGSLAALFDNRLNLGVGTSPWP